MHNLHLLSWCLTAAVYLDGLGARLALDVAAPVVLAVAVMPNYDRLHRVATPTTH